MTKILKIEKRSGQTVSFDQSKIERAIELAGNSVGKKDIPKTEIAKLVTEKLEQNHQAIPTVEHIQDYVEETLMEEGYSKVARSYILYREDRQQRRNKPEDSLLSRDFLSQYKHQPNPFPTT